MGFLFGISLRESIEIDILNRIIYRNDVIAMLVKVTGDSLLIHEFAYSLFISLCLV